MACNKSTVQKRSDNQAKAGIINQIVSVPPDARKRNHAHHVPSTRISHTQTIASYIHRRHNQGSHQKEFYKCQVGVQTVNFDNRKSKIQQQQKKNDSKLQK